MSLFGWISGMFSNSTGTASAHEMHGDLPSTDINPASGLPVIDGSGGIDVAGNHYGSNAASEAISGLDDSFSHDTHSQDNGLGGGFGGW